MKARMIFQSLLLSLRDVNTIMDDRPCVHHDTGKSQHAKGACVESGQTNVSLVCEGLPTAWLGTCLRWIVSFVFIFLVATLFVPLISIYVGWILLISPILVGAISWSIFRNYL